MDDDVILRLDSMGLAFGGVLALDGLSCEVRRGDIFGIIGPNGAGKTSAVNCISGFYRPQRGEVYLEGRRITGLRPDRIARLGVSRTFQNIHLYAGMTVIDNLMAARHLYFKATWLEGLVYYGRTHREEVQNRRRVEETIDFLGLARWRKAVVGALPYGLRKRIDLGRALVQEPRLLLLDEPMAGMNVEEKEDMARSIQDVKEEKRITTVLIEHDMEVVMDLTDRIAVLDFGRKIAEGTPAEIKDNPAVVQAYLGDETVT
ncbi:MAG: ABC transporter ATP-binding protein [Dehalococcoidia bacterium]|nr:ABC transporter ATP-binding protein [Dehalococcoidia bacterium]